MVDSLVTLSFIPLVSLKLIAGKFDPLMLIPVYLVLLFLNE